MFSVMTTIVLILLTIGLGVLFLFASLWEKIVNTEGEVICTYLYIACFIFAFLMTVTPFSHEISEAHVAYRELPAVTYRLQKITTDESFWYKEIIDGKSFITVYVTNPTGGVTKQTYDEDIVFFEEGDKAEISIVKEEAYWPDERWAYGEPKEPERIKSVIITVPIN